MNGAIFKVLGVVILLFDLVLALIFALSINRVGLRNGEFVQGIGFFLSFVSLSMLIAVGLIQLHRWAAITASVVGVSWALFLASGLGHMPWTAHVVGVPMLFCTLLPAYATIRNWSVLKPFGDSLLTSSYRALRSLDRFHLE